MQHPPPAPPPPRIAVLASGHANPLVFGRLAGALRHERIRLYAHIDARSDIAPFREAAGPAVRFLDRRVVNMWGAWSQVEAALGLLRAAHAEGPFDAYAFVSADCLPRLMPEALIAALAAVPTQTQFVRFPKDHIFHRRVTGIFLPHTGFGRLREITHWMDHLRIDPSEFDDILAAMRSARAKARIAFDVFKGSQWLSLSRRHLEALFGFLDREPDYTEIYRFSLIPDESFFQTALKQLFPNLRSRETLMGMHWPHPRGPSPQTLRAPEDIAIVRQARTLFFRKFADDGLDLVDAVLASRLGIAEAEAEGLIAPASPGPVRA